MNVRYKREMRHNYLIMDALEKNRESFEIRMLTVNSIEGILKFRMKEEEEHSCYYYEITSKQPLSRLLEFKEIRREELASLITGIGSVLNKMEAYLLQEANILLEPEHIYIEPETFQVWLCYVPGYGGDFPAAMEKLLQFLLKKADHQDNDTVVLAYRLYQESQKDYYGIEDLLRSVQESQKGNRQGNRNKSRDQDGREFEGREEGEGRKREGSKGKRPLEGEGDGWKETFFEEPSEEEGRKREGKLAKEKGFRKKQGKPGGEEEEKQRGKLTQKRKTGSKFAILAVPLLAAGCPVAVWLLAGEAGIRRYGGRMLLGEGAALILYILLLELKRKLAGKFNDGRNGGKEVLRVRESRKRESFEKKEKAKEREGLEKRGNLGRKPYRDKLEDPEWYMTFEGEEDGFEDAPDWEEEKGKRRQNRHSGSWAAGDEEDAEDILDMEGQNKDTMLLAEADAPEKKPHMLKSLDLSVGDIPVPYFPFIIGKQEGIVDHVLKRPTVSRLHLRIDWEEGEYKITDLNSSNGTVVAGKCLEANESCLVNSGDKVQIADLPFVFY